MERELIEAPAEQLTCTWSSGQQKNSKKYPESLSCRLLETVERQHRVATAENNRRGGKRTVSRGKDTIQR